MRAKEKFIVTGAGPVGLSLSILLKDLGNEVEIFDKRPDPRLNHERGRSINLALSNRGFNTLALAGLESEIKTELGIPMFGRMIHDIGGKTQLQPYSQDHRSIWSVSRSSLNNILLNAAEKKGLSVHFNQKCNGYNFEEDLLEFEDFRSDTKGKRIIACDGAFSALRNSMKLLPDFTHKEVKLDYAYKEFTIQAENSKHLMEVNALHIWPRKDFMLIALPNKDGSFTCTLFLKNSGEDSFEEINTAESARRFFEQYFHDALPLMKEFDEDYYQNPVSGLYMETCFPWNYRDKLLLLGDAAHAIVPFYGQGLNAGLEDVRLFIELLKDNETESVFSAFPVSRKKDTDAIALLALQNFVEMRDLVADQTFLEKKKIESGIKGIFKDRWTTQYEAVTFSDMPYHLAQEIGLQNNIKLEAVLGNRNLTEKLLSGNLNKQDIDLLSFILL